LNFLLSGSLGKFKKTENDQNMRESESDDEDLDKMRTLLLSTKYVLKKSYSKKYFFF